MCKSAHCINQYVKIVYLENSFMTWSIIFEPVFSFTVNLGNKKHPNMYVKKKKRMSMINIINSHKFLHFHKKKSFIFFSTLLLLLLLYLSYVNKYVLGFSFSFFFYYIFFYNILFVIILSFTDTVKNIFNVLFFYSYF